MLRHLLTLVSLFQLFSFELGDPPNDDPEDKSKKPKGITPEIEAFYKSIISRETKAARGAGKKSAEDAAEAQRQKDEEDRQRKKDEESGEYTKAKEALEKRATTAEESLASVTRERDALSTYFAGEYESALKELPEIVLAFKPDDDASFETKSAWLTKAREEAKKVSGDEKPGTSASRTQHKPTKPDTNAEQQRARDISIARSKIRI